MRTKIILDSVHKNFKKINNKQKETESRILPNIYRFKPREKDWEFIKRWIPTVLISITNRCNSFCKICFTNSSPFDYSKEMTKEDIIKILRKIGKNKRVILIGGEPTLREDLFEIIRLIKKSSNHPEIFTNGLKLANPIYVKRLKESGVRRVYLSFDGFSPYTYEKLVGNEKELELKLLAIVNLEAFGIETILTFRVIKNLNENEIKKTIDFVVNRIKNGGKIKGIYFYFATPGGRFLIKDGEIEEDAGFKLIERVTNRIVSREYLSEWNKLSLNLYKYFKRFGIRFVYGSSGPIGLFYTGSIKRAVSKSEIRKINKILENKKNPIILALNLMKIRLFRVAGLLYLIKRNIMDVVSSIPNLFVIGAENINTEIYHRIGIRDNVWIEKDSKKGSLFVRVTGFAAYYQE